MRHAFVSASLALGCAMSPAYGQETPDSLAKKLSNPIASLISVPLQYNADFGAAADGKGEFHTLNVQPVIPVALNNDWNLISRTVLPISARNDVYPGDDSVSGVGDTLQSFFFSPSQPTEDGLVWGIGPVFLLPTATDDRLGSEKWGIGPTAVALVQKGPWTAGALANHIWSVAGEEDRNDVNATFLQPFLGYALGRGRTVSAAMEASYDWESEQLTAPATLAVSQVLPVGKQLISVQVGGRYYLDAPANAPEWGVRATLTFLFPKK